MNRENLQKIAEKWQRENLELVSPYSEEQIKSAFDKIGKLVSKDILQVYMTFGGVADLNMDSNLLGFWTLEQIVDEKFEVQIGFSVVWRFFDFLPFIWV